MKIFVESPILVEYIKGNQTDLLEHLISSELELYTNAIVFSEFMFYYLAVIGEKLPLALKESNQIKRIIELHNPTTLFPITYTLANHKEIEMDAKITVLKLNTMNLRLSLLLKTMAYTILIMLLLVMANSAAKIMAWVLT